MSEASSRLRIDKWLWFARFVKTRSLAQKLCESGHVKLNGTSVLKPSQTVKVGDELVMVLGPVRKSIRIAQLGARRGPAAEAQALYAETAPLERLQGPRALAGAEVRTPGTGRPTKKDRRQIDKLKGF